MKEQALMARITPSPFSPIARTVDNYILKLRKKVEPKPSAPRHIL